MVIDVEKVPEDAHAILMAARSVFVLSAYPFWYDMSYEEGRNDVMKLFDKAASLPAIDTRLMSYLAHLYFDFSLASSCVADVENAWAIHLSAGFADDFQRLTSMGMLTAWYLSHGEIDKARQMTKLQLSYLEQRRKVWNEVVLLQEETRIKEMFAAIESAAGNSS